VHRRPAQLVGELVDDRAERHPWLPLVVKGFEPHKTVLGARVVEPRRLAAQLWRCMQVLREPGFEQEDAAIVRRAAGPEQCDRQERLGVWIVAHHP
jgi:hypothetical protein